MFIGRVVATETAVIPAGHEGIVRGAITNSCEELTGPFIEGGGELAQWGLVLGRSVVEVPTEVVHVSLFTRSKE